MQKFSLCSEYVTPALSLAQARGEGQRCKQCLGLSRWLCPHFWCRRSLQSERSTQSCWPLTQGKQGSTHHPLGRSKLDACQYDGGNNWEDLCSQMALFFSIHHSNIATFHGLSQAQHCTQQQAFLTYQKEGGRNATSSSSWPFMVLMKPRRGLSPYCCKAGQLVWAIWCFQLLSVYLSGT